MAPLPAIIHQRISGNLQFRLEQHLRRTGIGEMLAAPVGVRLTDDTVLGPDLLLVLKAHADRFGELAIMGAPDLVVEILSPGTAQRDLGRKRELYERHGVQEYWIVDPESRAIEVLSLADGRYARTGLFRRNQRLSSPLLEGFSVDLAEVFPG